MAVRREAPLPRGLPMDDSAQQTPGVGEELFTDNRRELETDSHIFGSLIYNHSDFAGEREWMDNNMILMKFTNKARFLPHTLQNFS